MCKYLLKLRGRIFELLKLDCALGIDTINAILMAVSSASTIKFNNFHKALVAIAGLT